MKSAVIEGLYLLTPDWDDTSRLLETTKAALWAGVRCLQYRHKTAGRSLAEGQAGRLRELTLRHGAALIINDDVALAQAVQADGVHLGRDDGPTEDARATWPEGLIGVSCYDDLERARAAARAGADYVAFGSVFASRTKPAAVHAPLALFGEARAAGLRTVAIGGIDAGNIARVAAAGAHAAALITAVYEAADPQAAAAQLITEWTRGREAYESGSKPAAV